MNPPLNTPRAPQTRDDSNIFLKSTPKPTAGSKPPFPVNVKKGTPEQILPLKPRFQRAATVATFSPKDTSVPSPKIGQSFNNQRYEMNVLRVSTELRNYLKNPENSTARSHHFDPIIRGEEYKDFLSKPHEKEEIEEFVKKLLLQNKPANQNGTIRSA